MVEVAELEQLIPLLPLPLHLLLLVTLRLLPAALQPHMTAGMWTLSQQRCRCRVVLPHPHCALS